MNLQDYQPNTTPFKHQADTFAQTAHLKSWGLLWEQGTGKTKAAIDNACALYEADEIDAVLVVAPNGVHRNWLTDELPKHVPDRLRRSCRAMYWDTPKSATQWHQKEADKLVKHDGLAFFFMPYSAFTTERGKKFVWRFLRRRRCYYVLDEAHLIKTPKAKTTRSVVASGKYAPYRRILTGTPVANGPFDIYSQIRFLDEKFWENNGLSTFREFKFHFGEWFTAAECEEINGYDPGYDKLIRYKNLNQLNELLAKIATRITKDDVLDLPSKLYSKRYFDMSKEQERLYKQLKEEFIAELENGDIVDGSLAITRLLRLQQIACGYVQAEGEEPVQLIGKTNPRLEALTDITDNLQHPAIIWARFTKDIDQIMDALGSRAVRYDGQVSDDERARAKEAFQNGDAQVFVSNPQAGATGLTLTQAQTVIYYSNSFKLVDRLQSEDRAHRIGQEHPVNYIDLVAGGTVDEKIVRSLRDKWDVAAQITGDELKDWL